MSYPILYKANETNFDHFGLGTLADAISCQVIEEINGVFELEMMYPLGGKRADLLKYDNLIKVDTGHAGFSKNQLFRIERVDKTAKMIQVYAMHVSRLVQGLALEPEVQITNQTASGALEIWRNSIVEDHPFRVSSDITIQRSVALNIKDHQNGWQALSAIQNTWGGEYIFDNHQIHLRSERGGRANTLISYGRNLTDLNQEENITNTFTSIYPYAIYREDDDERIVTIPGFVVDSDNAKHFAHRRVLPVDFSREFDRDETPTADRLKELAQAYLEEHNIGVPMVSIALRFVDLTKSLNQAGLTYEQVNLCDMIPVRFEKLGIDTVAKITRVTWDVLLDQYDALEIGETRTTISDTIRNIERDLSEASTNTDSALTAANGKNAIFFGTNEPIPPFRVGDLWYRPNGEHTELWMWDGHGWKFIMSTAPDEVLLAKIEEAEIEAERALKQANEAMNEAENARTHAISLHEEALREADGVRQTANEAQMLAQEAFDKAEPLARRTDELNRYVTSVTAIAEGLQTSVVDLENHTASNMTQLSDQINLRISGTSHQNMLRNSTWNHGRAYWLTNFSVSGFRTRLDPYPDKPTSHILQLGRSTDSLQRHQSDNVKIVIGRTYTVSLDVKIEGSLLSNRTVLAIRTYADESNPGGATAANNTGTNIIQTPANLGITSTGNWQRVSVTFTPNRGEFLRIALYNADHDQIRAVEFREIMLTEGINQTGWSPHAADNDQSSQLTLLQDQIDMRVTNEQHQTSLGVLNGLIAARVTNEAMSSAITQSANGINLRINNEISQLGSSMTLLENQFNVSLANASGRNMLRNSTWNNGREHWMQSFGTDIEHHAPENDKPASRTLRLRRNSSPTQRFPSNNIRIVLGRTYTVSFDVRIDGAFNNQTIFAARTYGSTNNSGGGTDAINTGWQMVRSPSHFGINGVTGWRRVSFSFTPTRGEWLRITPYNADTTAVRNVWFREIMLTEGTTQLAWSLHPADQADFTTSQFTMLTDTINLRTTGQNIVNQINISPRGITIAGNKVNITGETFIESGRIANALVGDLQAVNVNTNTLVAGIAEVIELDANRITTGTLNAGRIAAGTITANHLAANSIRSEHINTNSLNGNRITARTLNVNALNVTNLHEVETLSPYNTLGWVYDRTTREFRRRSGTWNRDNTLGAEGKIDNNGQVRAAVAVRNSMTLNNQEVQFQIHCQFFNAHGEVLSQMFSPSLGHRSMSLVQHTFQAPSTNTHSYSLQIRANVSNNASGRAGNLDITRISIQTYASEYLTRDPSNNNTFTRIRNGQIEMQQTGGYHAMYGVSGLMMRHLNPTNNMINTGGTRMHLHTSGMYFIRGDRPVGETIQASSNGNHILNYINRNDDAPGDSDALRLFGNLTMVGRHNSGVQVLSSGGGDIITTGSGRFRSSAALVISSSKEFKEDIRPVINIGSSEIKSLDSKPVGIDVINNLKVVTYRLKKLERDPFEGYDISYNGINHMERQIGVIAEDSPDIAFERGEIPSIDTGKVMWHSVLAIQQLYQKCITQETEIKKLKQEMETLQHGK